MARYSDVKKNFWITREEDNKLKEKCYKAQISESEYFRKCINNKILKEKPDDEFFKIYSDLSNAQNNLNQIAKKLNQGCYVPKEKIQECISTLAILSRALMKKYC